jgi:hypothetical protein
MGGEEIRLVNRAAVVVIPKQSFIDWANHFNDGGPVLNLEDARRHPDVVLVDDLENEPKPEKVLRRYYRTIFEHELEAWMTDEDTWPLKRDIHTFRDWFDIDICIMVFNLASDPLWEEPY